MSTTDGIERTPAGATAEPASPSPAALLRRRALSHRGITFGGGTLLFIVFVALAAPLLAPHDPYFQDLGQRMLKPIWDEGGTWAHPLGTDSFGRDYLSRIIYGARVSLLIGFSAMLLSGLVGTALGIAAGYFGGRVDMVVTTLVTTRLAMPAILIALAVVSLVGSSLEIIILVLGLLLWDRFAVVMRAATQQVRNLDYVAAAEAIGCSTTRIILTETLPNVANPLIVIATLEIAHAVLLEAALSFLGLGVQPPTPSWGLMISEGKTFMFFDPWVICIPGFALFALVMSVNLLGDGIRDVTAPENRS
ncbi:MAG: ABC transporter permease [Rhodospirillales bacterium]|nr:ABC transporter permease [Rhodospirillales bacterium]